MILCLVGRAVSRCTSNALRWTPARGEALWAIHVHFWAEFVEAMCAREEFCSTASRTRQGNGVADCVSGECLSCADGAFAGGDFSWGLCIDGSWPINRKLLPFCILMEFGKEQVAGQTNCGRRVAVLCSAVLASSEFGLGWRVGKVDPG